MSQRQLIWRRFKTTPPRDGRDRHRRCFAVYLVVPFSPISTRRQTTLPKTIEAGAAVHCHRKWLRLFDGLETRSACVRSWSARANQFLRKIVYERDCEIRRSMSRFLGRGYDTYSLLRHQEMDRHLFTVEEPYVIKEGSTAATRRPSALNSSYWAPMSRAATMYSRLMRGTRLSIADDRPHWYFHLA